MKTFNFRPRTMEQEVQWDLIVESPSTPFVENNVFGSFSVRKKISKFKMKSPNSKVKGKLYLFNFEARKSSRNNSIGGSLLKRQNSSRGNPSILSESCSINTSFYSNSNEGEEEEGKRLFKD